MKKIYIRPSVEVEIMETLDMIADSGTVATNDAITDETIDEEDKSINGNLTGGDGTNFGTAKNNNVWGFDDSWH